MKTNGADGVRAFLQLGIVKEYQNYMTEHPELRQVRADGPKWQPWLTLDLGRR